MRHEEITKNLWVYPRDKFEKHVGDHYKRTKVPLILNFSARTFLQEKQKQQKEQSISKMITSFLSAQRIVLIARHVHRLKVHSAV